MDLQKLRAQLIQEEGLELEMYKDSRGIPTIGVGHNLMRPITAAAALQILSDDIADHVADISRLLPWWKDLDDVRQRVIVSMCFNLGIDGLMGFTRMIAAIKAGDFDAAADAMLDSLWTKQVKSRAIKLARMMRTGKDYGSD